VVKGFQCGANDYIPKPFFKEELIARINTLLEARESVRRLKNNTLLKNEIDRRKKIEEKLRTLQRRMIRILDAASDAIIAVNLQGTVLFFNQQAETRLAYTADEVLNQPAKILFNQQGVEAIQNLLSTLSEPMPSSSLRKKEFFSLKQGSGKPIDVIADIVAFVVENEPLAAIIIRTEDKSFSESYGDIAMNGALNELPYLLKSQTALTFIRNMSPELDTLQDVLPPLSSTDKSAKEREEDLRESLVHLMITAINLWETSTGKSKIDLAEESGLWKAYLDRGTYKTRTLDKYLSIKTLPKKPRWREVVKTAYYVTMHGGLTEENEHRLKDLISETEGILGKRF
jgi:two-component system sensor histidine kinase ChiS